MSITYIEEYNIPGLSTFGIEDYETPGQHFMPDMSHKRFKVWKGGSGGWEFDTLPQARQKILDYATAELQQQQSKAIADVERTTNALADLGDDAFNLGLYRKRREEAKEPA